MSPNRFKHWLEKRREKRALQNIRESFWMLGYPLLDTDEEIKKAVEIYSRVIAKTNISSQAFFQAIKRLYKEVNDG